MKIVLVLTILILVTGNGLGQNFWTITDAGNNVLGSKLIDAKASLRINLKKKFTVEYNLGIIWLIQSDFRRFQNHNLKFKITFSDSWLTRDKAHHFLTSAFLSAAGYYFLLHDKQSPLQHRLLIHSEAFRTLSSSQIR